MSFDDRTADRKAHSQAAGLCRVEGLEEALETRWSQSRTRILHRNEHAVRLGFPGAYQQFTRPLPGAAHCFDGVDDQVKDHLLQLNPVSFNERQALCELRLHRNT